MTTSIAALDSQALPGIARVQLVPIPTNIARRYRHLAALWRANQAEAKTGDHYQGGYVIMHAGRVCGWTIDLANPSSWVPGCIAAGSPEEPLWMTFGGDDWNGAKVWKEATP